MLWGRVTVADSPLRIARRFHADVAEADRKRHRFRASRTPREMPQPTPLTRRGADGQNRILRRRAPMPPDESRPFTGWWCPPVFRG
ncbi:hypothetical protein FAGKG844_540011 [Frankia sp. AgKG'84/4]